MFDTKVPPTLQDRAGREFPLLPVLDLFPGQKIAAIQYIREYTGVDLKTAKDAIDAAESLRASHGEPTPPEWEKIQPQANKITDESIVELPRRTSPFLLGAGIVVGCLLLAALTTWIIQ